MTQGRSAILDTRIHSLVGGRTIEDKTIHTFQVAMFHPAIEVFLPCWAHLAAAQMMNY